MSDSFDGHDWDNAYGTEMGLMWALMKINNNGVIYLADGTYTQSGSGSGNNITIIGLNREGTIFDINDFSANGDGAYMENAHSVTTYINMTFKNPTVMLQNGQVFINCTFISPIIKTNADIYSMYQGTPENLANVEQSFDINFTDCDFVNYDIEGSLLEAFRFSQINFNNCNFKDIAANAIVNNTGGFTLQDAINFYDCTFNNVTVKGIVDVPTGTNPNERYRIEGCTFDVPVTNEVVTDSGRDYINTTQSRADSNLAIDIDGDNLVITLTDSEGNPIADVDEISVVINDENIPSQMDNGVTTLNISDFTGKVNIVASFAGNSNYKESTATLNTYIVVKTVTEVINNTIVEYVNKTLESTSIDANALTATAKVAKTLSVTLKDASGKAIANKVITYSINGVTKTVKTDANGIAKITVNQAKAGAYYYSLCFLGDDDYKSAFKSVKVTVNKQATKAVFKAKTFKVKAKTKKVSFTLKDASGKAIKGKKITVKVNGKTYTAKTNAKGVATVSLKITKKGKYTATAKFAGDTTYKAITKKAKITLK